MPRTLLRRGVWRGDCALEELFVRRERLAGGGRHRVWRCSGGEGGGEFAVKEYDLADARTCLREAALLERLHHPAVVRVVAVFRNGDKVMDGSVDVWVLAVPLLPWTAAHIAVDSGVRTLPGHFAAQGGVDAGVRGLAETGSTAATDVFALGRTVAALRDKCFGALRDERCGTSASLRCVTSAPGQVLRCAA